MHCVPVGPSIIRHSSIALLIGNICYSLTYRLAEHFFRQIAKNLQLLSALPISGLRQGSYISVSRLKTSEPNPLSLATNLYHIYDYIILSIYTLNSTAIRSGYRFRPLFWSSCKNIIKTVHWVKCDGNSWAIYAVFSVIVIGLNRLTGSQFLVNRPLMRILVYCIP